ncbi:hypothetical protein SSS_09662 [Sarcoptes scabiei]|uniref:Uncharacterized protein n=1 Tax=Sarcoptes scabiei TaxID=52283 RepID=A0A834RE96_SARSC|nr:hypothetical protein SSS_09662 [Sarcoptes scabiei]
MLYYRYKFDPNQSENFSMIGKKNSQSKSNPITRKSEKNFCENSKSNQQDYRENLSHRFHHKNVRMNEKFVAKQKHRKRMIEREESDSNLKQLINLDQDFDIDTDTDSLSSLIIINEFRSRIELDRSRSRFETKIKTKFDFDCDRSNEFDCFTTTIPTTTTTKTTTAIRFIPVIVRIDPSLSISKQSKSLNENSWRNVENNHCYLNEPIRTQKQRLRCSEFFITNKNDKTMNVNVNIPSGLESFKETKR